VGLVQSPLSLVSTIQELLERWNSSSLENLDYGRRDSSRWPHGTLYPQKLALTSPTSGGHSVSIVRSRTQATEFYVGQTLQSLRKGQLHIKRRLNCCHTTCAPNNFPAIPFIELRPRWWQKRTELFVLSGQHFCSTLTKIGMRTQIVFKVPNVNFHLNPLSGFQICYVLREVLRKLQILFIYYL
jgi:hypothetical protein